jgi:hypothetical protein
VCSRPTSLMCPCTVRIDCLDFVDKVAKSVLLSLELWSEHLAREEWE